MSKEQTDSKRAEKWTFALTVVSLIAGGTVVAGLVDRWSSSPSDDISVAASSSITMTSTPDEIPAEDVPEFSYVTPSAVYPTTIPGCESVEAPEEDSFFSYILDGSDTYDDPRFPWFSSAKAAAMSEAVKQALPKDVELKFASPGNSLQFGPISAPSNTDGLPEGFSLEELASTTASGTLIRDGKIGALSLMLHSSSDPIPSCVAGSLVERRVLADQSVVDLQDTWSETNGVRTLNRSAMLYGVDGTRIQAYLNDTNNDGGPDAESSGVVPLTLDELVTLVEMPQLRITTPVPPGTAPLQIDCGGWTDESSGRELDRGIVDALGEALRSGWRAAPSEAPDLGSQLGDLVLAENDTTTACQYVVARSGGNESRLSISITSGQPLPTPPNKYDPSYDGHPLSMVTAEDGSVIERDESRWENVHRSVVVTHPGGTQVTVSSSAEAPNVPMTFEQLEFLATIDGLEIR
ncbi:hypothetical protein [Rhodococcus sp. APC 3903]|uniref:hypothetical protein n=1 Tax=Rhodococcus sp. APC 3903 TaxID=3035193 RepID=UPI0025B3A236|nr:hypothetical protein [Rhodococcus sp. APC 3903]MDN3460478.1 hypothetical protein [Rhodococcus sp. APC 3903]